MPSSRSKQVAKITKDEARKTAQQLILILGCIEVAGGTLIVLPWLRIIEGPFALIAMALGVLLVVGCLIGFIWTGIQLARLQGGE